MTKCISLPSFPNKSNIWIFLTNQRAQLFGIKLHKSHKQSIHPKMQKNVASLIQNWNKAKLLVKLKTQKKSSNKNWQLKTVRKI